MPHTQFSSSRPPLSGFQVQSHGPRTDSRGLINLTGLTQPTMAFHHNLGPSAGHAVKVLPLSYSSSPPTESPPERGAVSPRANLWLGSLDLTHRSSSTKARSLLRFYGSTEPLDGLLGPSTLAPNSALGLDQTPSPRAGQVVPPKGPSVFFQLSQPSRNPIPRVNSSKHHTQ